MNLTDKKVLAILSKLEERVAVLEKALPTPVSGEVSLEKIPIKPVKKQKAG